MPVTKQLRVVVGERGESGLMRGDTVTIKGASGVVAQQRELNTNMEVTFESGHKRGVPLGSEINVLRIVLTDDEQDAEDLERFHTKTISNYEAAKRSVEQMAGLMMNRFLDGQAKGYLYPFDLGLAAELARYQERAALWENIRADMDDLHDHMAALRAVVRARRMCEARLLGDRRTPLSRSTSVISNLTEDMRNEAMADFLQDTKWMDADGLWERLGVGQAL